MSPSHSRKLQPWKPTNRVAMASVLSRRFVLYSIMLAAVTAALYLPVCRHPFLNWDDDDYVTDNIHVKAGLSSDTIAWAFTTYDAANWHPVTWLSHALDYQFFELDPAGHHATNLLLHVINAVLLFWVLWRATGCFGRSFAVAALFALHPVNVESVAWVAQRKNTLSLLFFLLALGAYRWYAEHPRVGRYLTVAALFVLGLMSKPQVITLPFVLLLWDYWPLQRLRVSPPSSKTRAGSNTSYQRSTLRQLIVEKLPLLALSVVSAAITVRAQHLGGGINPDVPLGSRLGNALVSYVRYIRDAFWPLGLAPMYPFPRERAGLWVLAAVLLLATTMAVILARRWRYLPVGWFWFLGTLVPMIGLVQVGRQAMADRYAYLPFIGLFLMLVWGVADLGEWYKIGRVWQMTIAGAAVLLLAIGTHRQLGYWSDNVTLWAHTTQVTGGNYLAEDALGRALEASGRPDDAAAHYRTAIAIDPSSVFPYVHVGIYLHQRGELQEALANYQRVIALTQDDVTHFGEVRHRIFANMASAYSALGDYQRARQSLEAALALNPDSAEEWTNLGLLAQKTGDNAQAIHAYSQAVEIRPTARRYQLLARCLLQAGRTQEAEAAFQQSMALPAD